eukprot:2669267-Karenia_brevis.AAC.1
MEQGARSREHVDILGSTWGFLVIISEALWSHQGIIWGSSCVHLCAQTAPRAVFLGPGEGLSGRPFWPMPVPNRGGRRVRSPALGLSSTAFRAVCMRETQPGDDELGLPLGSCAPERGPGGGPSLW